MYICTVQKRTKVYDFWNGTGTGTGTEKWDWDGTGTEPRNGTGTGLERKNQKVFYLKN